MSVADDMQTGAFCATCGVFLGDPTGHPRWCDGCADDAPDEELVAPEPDSQEEDERGEV